MFKPPKPLMYAHNISHCLDSLLYNKERLLEKGGTSSFVFYNPLNLPTLCGHVIPDFQRGLVWSDEQNLRLIESVYRGIPIGSYSVNFSSDDLPPRVTNVLIDGQQRLNALNEYWEDRIVYRGYRWSELTRRQRGPVYRTMFPQMRTNSKDENEVREYYNAMNFGGTDHVEGERA